MADIVLNLTKLSLDDLYTFATTLHTGMVAQAATFPTPNPTPAAFLTAITDGQTANNAYETGKVTLSGLLTTRDTKADVMRGFIKQWMNYSMNTSADPTKWQAVGFTLKGASTPVGPLGAVQDLKLTAGDNEGTLDVGWDPLKGAISYEIQTSTEPVTGTSWNFCAVSVKSTTTLAGFTSGTKMWVRVRGIGANNQKGPWSDPAVKTVP